jgi:aminotransferase in exopolysaccharide biosynthesis
MIHLSETSVEKKILPLNNSDILSFIRKVFKEPSGTIPLHGPVFIGNEMKYLEECLNSTLVSSVGKFVNIFEDQMAEFTGAKRAVVCVNGTNALYLALKISGVEQGDEVITQPLTFIATANAISYCGATPVFLDVDRDTMGLSAEALKKFLLHETTLKDGKCVNRRTGKRIKACVPMHTFGHPCRIEEIATICDEYNLTLVEDAAESVGSYYKGQHTGTFGSIGVLSFNGNKTITTGGGGMMLFNDEELADRAKYLSTQAKNPHQWEFVHNEIGYNFRMPNINAAIGVAQLENLDVYLEKKRSLANKYHDFFKQSSVEFFKEPQDCRSNYWLNAILFDSRSKRDGFLSESNAEGILTRPLWKLMNRLPMYRDCQTDSLEICEWLEDRVVAIPSSVIL